MGDRFVMSLTVLLYELDIPYENTDILEQDIRLGAIKLYSSDMETPDNCLVVGTLSDTMSVWEEYPNCYFLCLRDRFVDISEEKRNKKNVVILRTNYNVETIFNKIMDILQRLQQWNTDMLVSVLTNQGLQSLIDLSESVIGNHIDVMDATFKLLAYTKNIPIDDEVTNYLIRHGYHSTETIERLIKLRRFEEYEQMDDLILSTDYKMCNYETVKRVFHLNDRIHFYVVMHCNRKRIEPGMLELFRHLLRYIKKYTDKNTINPATFAASQNYLRDLLEKKMETIDEAVNRASYASIPFQKKYCLFLISFQDNFNVPLETIVMILSRHIFSAYVLSFNRRIVILQHVENVKDFAQIKEKTVQLLEQYLNDTPCTIGLSNVFDNLWQITSAMEQAGCAIEYGAHVELGLTAGERKPVTIYDFEESFLTLIVAKSFNSSPQLFGNCLSVNAIRLLEQYDTEHGTGLTQTLDVYLESGKKATEVCQKLHMHRNTVLYHIDRIESILGISLQSQEVCMKLQLGLMMRRTHMQDMIDAGMGRA